MKARHYFIFIFLAITLSCFIACNMNANLENNFFSDVDFSPTVAKTLDPSSAAIFSRVSDYHWKYYCSTQAPSADTDSLTWLEFEGSPETGLGTIRNLTRNDSYYFGLRGYTTGSDGKLIWEGFHYGIIGNAKIPDKVVLTGKTMLISIDIFTRDYGYIYFNISAPPEGEDRFVYSYANLGDEESFKDLILSTTFSQDSALVVYADDVNKPKLMLKVGTYLFAVKQQTWSSALNAFVDVPQREQRVVVSVVAGADSVIAGSLGSKDGLDAIYYEAGDYSENDKEILIFETIRCPDDLEEFVET